MREITICGVVARCFIGVICLLLVAVGIACLSAYRTKHNHQMEFASYQHVGLCEVKDVMSISNTSSCKIFLYKNVVLYVPASQPLGRDQRHIVKTLQFEWAKVPSLFFAYSNFFDDECGGTLLEPSDIGTGVNKTCWYKDLGTPKVYIGTDAVDFGVSFLYLGIGAALVLCGGVPLLYGVGVSCYRCIYRLLSIMFDWDTRAARDHSPTNVRSPQMGRNASAQDSQSAVVEMEEVSTAADGWHGRLITKNDFAANVVETLRTLQVNGAPLLEECPLCFRPYDGAVVWWTCGHLFCAECSVRVGGGSSGHSTYYKCPVCREVSDGADVVRIALWEVATTSPAPVVEPVFPPCPPTICTETPLKVSLHVATSSGGEDTVVPPAALGRELEAVFDRNSPAAGDISHSADEVVCRILKGEE